MRYSSLGTMFLAKLRENPSKTAYMFKKDGQWLRVTYKEAIERATNLAGGMADLGIKKGDKVAIISGNRVEWALTDFAAQTLGAVLVPIYPSLLKEQVQYILNDSESKVVFAEDEVQIEKVDSVRSNLKSTKHFFAIDESVSDLKEPWKSYDNLVEQGKTYLQKHPQYVDKEAEKVKEDDWATIIYTSGTTGEPKGAILTHKNLLSNIEAGLQCLEVTPEDVFLSFLPLSHVFERMAGHFLAYYTSTTIAYAESIDTVAENMGEIRPTVMTSVPRLYEKMYARVLENVEKGSAVKQKIFHWAVGVGQKYVKHISEGTKPSGMLEWKRGLAYKLVFAKLAERVGGRLRFFVSGGAPLSQEIGEFFGAAGLLILEGYGLTETSPVISVNRLDKFKFGSVGPVVPGVEVNIAEDGEILTRGPHVMVGYFKKEAETREVIDDDGWFHTGDIGFIDDQGFLKITDRKKNIIVTAGGKNIAPQPIENTLITSKYIDQVMIIGDRRKFCSAVIVASEDALAKWAEGKGLSWNSFEELVKLDGVEELIQSEIDRLSAGLASYETIKKFFLAPRAFTIETGELTPSLKVKRRVVEDEYKQQIEAMYKNNN